MEVGENMLFIEDESIGFIGSERQVGRVAESLRDLLAFLLHAEFISDFSCCLLYQNKHLLSQFCKGFIDKTRENYQSKGEEWDKGRTRLAQELGLEFDPEKLQMLALKFYQSAIRTLFSLVNMVMLMMNMFVILLCPILSACGFQSLLE